MTPLVLLGLTALLAGAADNAQAFVAAVGPIVRTRITGPDGKPDRALADLEQHVVHGFAWYASYAELMRQVANWAAKLEAEGGSARSTHSSPSCSSPNMARSSSAASR